MDSGVVENLARRCGGFLKNLSLSGCQVKYLLICGRSVQIEVASAVNCAPRSEQVNGSIFVCKCPIMYVYKRQ